MSDERTRESTRQLPLRQRLPDYAVIFAVGLAVACLVGLALGVLSDVRIGQAIGYTIALSGAVWMLGGGLSGGGYSVLGVGEGVGRHTYMKGDGNQMVMEGLRRGYRPQANVGAFWRVVGGLLQVAIGGVVVVLTL